VLNGSTTNVTSSAIPITAHGVSDTHGSVKTSGSDSKGTLHLADGTLDVDHTAGSGPTHVNKAACSATSVMNGTYKVTGGTGKYKGATGHGDFAITFAGNFSHNGKCNLSANASPSSGKLSFHATGTWTVKN
jgi:hypothetical protein